MSFIALSYGSAAVAYSLLTVVLLVKRESVAQGYRVLVTVVVTAIWGSAIALALALPTAASRVVVPVSDAARVLFWLAALVAAIPGRVTWNNVKGLVLAISALLADRKFERPATRPASGA